MIQFIKKYKNFFHVLLSVLILWFWDWLLKPIIKDDLYFIAVLICSITTAFLIEKIQQQLKLGTATAIGGLKSSVAVIIYTVLKIIEML